MQYSVCGMHGINLPLQLLCNSYYIALYSMLLEVAQSIRSRFAFLLAYSQFIPLYFPIAPKHFCVHIYPSYKCFCESYNQYCAAHLWALLSLSPSLSLHLFVFSDSLCQFSLSICSFCSVSRSLVAA